MKSHPKNTMNRTFAISLFLCTAFLLPARAAYLNFEVNAYDPEETKYFDYARVGVAKDGEIEWGGEGGDEQVFLNIASTPGSDVASASYLAADDARYTARGWADLEGYIGSEYLFYIETWANDGNEPVMRCFDGEAMSYAMLLSAGHIHTPGVTDPQDTSPWIVPEPSGGLLVLVGAGLAAWRRRRREFKIDKIDKVDRRR